MSSQSAYIEQCFDAYSQLVIGIYLIDLNDGAILMANQAGLDQLKMTLPEIRQQTVFNLRQDITDLAHWREIIQAIRAESPYTSLCQHVRGDGSGFPGEVVSHLVKWGDSEYLLSEVSDISRRQQQEDDLRQREPLLSFALNEATDGMWDWNLETDEVFFSPRLKQMLEYGPYEMAPVLESWKGKLHPEDLDHVMHAMDQHLQGHASRYEAQYRLANRNGKYLWMEDRGMVCRTDDHGQPLRVVGMVHNINEQKELEQRLRNLATTDELTGLLNRRAGYAAFEQLLKLAVRHNNDLCIAIIDLDNFKTINDNHGHQVGDKVLKSAADTFASRVRSSDVLMRWGGEEFLLVMPQTRPEDAFHVCEDLRHQLAEQILRSSRGDIQCTISIGMQHLTQQNNSIKKLVKDADAALYRAKSLGKNRIITA